MMTENPISPIRGNDTLFVSCVVGCITRNGKSGISAFIQTLLKIKGRNQTIIPIEINDLSSAWATSKGSIAFDLIQVIVVSGKILPNVDCLPNLKIFDFVGIDPKNQVTA